MTYAGGNGVVAKTLSWLVVLGLCLAGLLGPLQVAAAQGQPGEVNDVIILVDITGSMKGLGDAIADIWDEVLVRIIGLVDVLPPESHVAIVPFDSGIRFDQTYPPPPLGSTKIEPVMVKDPAIREEIKAHLRALRVDGQNTWIYESLEAALALMKEWQAADPTRVHRQSLFLYTDGQDNGPHRELGIAGIVQLFEAARTDMPYLYAVYGDIRHHLPPQDRRALEQAGVVVTAGLPQRRVVVLTHSLDFGDLSQSPQGVSREIIFSSTSPMVWGIEVHLRIEGDAPVTLAPETIRLTERVRILLKPAPGGMTPGFHTARLVLVAVEVDRHVGEAVNALVDLRGLKGAQAFGLLLIPVALGLGFLQGGITEPVLLAGALGFLALLVNLAGGVPLPLAPPLKTVRLPGIVTRAPAKPVVLDGDIHKRYRWTFKQRPYQVGTAAEFTAELDISRERYEACRQESRELDPLRWDRYVVAPLPEVDVLAWQLGELHLRREYCTFDQAANTLAFAQQCIAHTQDLSPEGEPIEYPRYPIESLVEEVGDCEDQAILAAALLKRMGFDVALLFCPGHAALGVAGAEGLPGDYVEDPRTGVTYFYGETTSHGWDIGEVPQDLIKYLASGEFRIVPIVRAVDR